MPRPVEAIPAVGRAAVHRALHGAGSGFKRPASGQVLQTFDAGDLVVEHWPDGRPRAVGLAWAAGVLAVGLVVAALFLVMVHRGVRAHGDGTS